MHLSTLDSASSSFFFFANNSSSESGCTLDAQKQNMLNLQECNVLKVTVFEQ